jgi:lauroyl/myristoyl acyltransferase
MVRLLKSGLRRIQFRGRPVSEICWEVLDELLRAFLMAFVLRLSAGLLSRKKALGVARWCGSVMSRIPSSGRSALMTTEKAFLMKGDEATRNAQEYLAQPFYSFVILHRLMSGREKIEEWKIEERNSREVDQLRESGQSFIVATGHFRRDSYIALWGRRICPGKLLSVTVSLPPKSPNPHDIRVRIQLGQLLRAMKHIRPDLEIVEVGIESMVRVLEHLKQGGSQAIITVDAFWSRKGSKHTRPFAGMRARSFSIGSSTLGRLAQCPIAPCVTYTDADGTCVVEWGSVIHPPGPEDKRADLGNGNAILDFFEKPIGLRPTQYSLYIGEERQWNRHTQMWEDDDPSN